MKSQVLLVEDRVISVVLPCLDEEVTVGVCVGKARSAIQQLGFVPDVIVVDNGSKDRSVEQAIHAGARVIVEPEKGYGNALRTGIEAANGQIIVMADADDTYDLSRLDEFLKPILNGQTADFVMGNRFGSIKKGAMPFLNRYIGNPVLSFILRSLFGTDVRDVHCGMRAFTKEAYRRLNLVTTGMEFASEMVIRAASEKLKIGQVNIPYHLRQGKSKLRPFRDGWRHLRLMLLYSPDFLYIVPAAFFWIVGAVIVLMLTPKPIVMGTRVFDVHTMIIGAVANIVGLQLGAFGLIAKAYGHFTGLRSDSFIRVWSGRVRLEHGLILGLILGLCGLFFLGYVVFVWAKADFGHLTRIRELILGLVILSNAIVVSATSFVLSLMTIQSKVD
jgi:glycosyltransferase involved in cell wall biosynthesis